MPCCSHHYLGFWRAILAEVIGTFLINLLVGPLAGQLEQTDPVDVLLYSVLYACVSIAMTVNFRDVSGGHLNPAVTIAMLVSRRIEVPRALLYITAQCSGGVMGSALIYALLRDKYVGATLVDDKLDISQAFGMETMGTFMYVFSYFAAMDKCRKEGAIGGSPAILMMAMFTAIAFTRPYTGGSINPARSLGPAIIEGQWNRHWVFWLGPLVGGSVGGFLYDLLFAANASRRRALSFISDGDYNPDSGAELNKVRVTSTYSSTGSSQSHRHYLQYHRPKWTTRNKSHRDQQRSRSSPRSRSPSHHGGNIEETSLSYEKMASV